MYAHPLPQKANPIELKVLLYDKYKIEIPITAIDQKYYIRQSFQCYNTDKDYDYLYEALSQLC